MTLAILGLVKARLSRFRDAAAGSFDSLRQAMARRLAAVRAAATAGLDRTIDRARGLAAGVCHAVDPRLQDTLDVAGQVVRDPDALPHLARAYAALVVLDAAAGLIGLPCPLQALFAIAGGVARLALVAHVLATTPGRLATPGVARMALHRLRAAVAAGLLAMAALSFCLGQALYCEPQIVTAAPAIVASAPVDPAGPLDRGINGPSIRPGRRIATETALA